MYFNDKPPVIKMYYAAATLWFLTLLIGFLSNFEGHEFWVGWRWIYVSSITVAVLVKAWIR